MKKFFHYLRSGWTIFVIIFSFLWFPFSNSVLASGSISIENLRCEYRTNPLGIDVPTPRLSWTLKSDQRGQHQKAYQILVATSPEKLNADIGDIWDSGKVLSALTAQISYDGVPLLGDRHYYWKVRVWDKDGTPSLWSTPSFWLTGLMQDRDWDADWIGLDTPIGDDDPDVLNTRLSARMLRHDFNIGKKLKRATAYVCGLGLFELYLNGKKIGDQVLSPGLTEYNKRAYYMTFDVTDNLVHGENAVGVILGNGRYFAPRSGDPSKTRTYGYPKLLMQINLHFEDGTSSSIISDENWKILTEGPIRANNEYDGEIYDARLERDGWTEPGFDASTWLPVEQVEKPGEKLEAQPNEPIKVMQTIQPIAVSEPQPGVFIFDMGQNMVGWVRLKVQGKRGSSVTLRFSEVLKDDGMLYLDNIRSAKVTDVYTLKGDGLEIWEPKFTYHGFRFVEMKGFPGKPDLTAIEGQVVYDAVENTGTFECSNPLINNIYKNAVWGVMGNYRSIPTDCPQRDERQGWLGDRSAESRGESFIFDISKLYNKWMVDIQDAQKESGSIPDVAPSYWPIYSDNTTWPGSYIIIPAMLYEQYGDLNTLKRHYPTMKKWIAYMSQYVVDRIMTRDTYGDWCVPPENLNLIHSTDPNRTTNAELIGTAYFYYELNLMADFARLLGHTKDSEAYQEHAKNMKKAFNKKFLSEDPLQYTNNSQTSSVLALAFGLVPTEYEEAIFNNLVLKIMGESEGHIGTGLIGGQWLMRVLTKYGRSDIAYTLASNDTYPSWGYMVKQDATTIWELWNGDKGDPGMNSHNHVMLLGDLIIWLYENLSGIKSDPQQPAFSHITMHPEIFEDLYYVKSSYQSVRGLIKSSWKIKSNDFYWDISIPANTTATIYVPAMSKNDVQEGKNLASNSEGVKFIRLQDNRAVFQLESGQYAFISENFELKTFKPFVYTPIISPGDTIVPLPNEFEVEMISKTSNVKIHYTLDGSEVSESAQVYVQPFNISKSTVLRAKAFKEDYHASAERSVFYDFVNPKKNGVMWKLYRGAFTNLPDFTQLEAEKSGRTYQISLEDMDIPQGNFALTFMGQIDIEHLGTYTFYTNSNDGSQLFINGQTCRRQ